MFRAFDVDVSGMFRAFDVRLRPYLAGLYQRGANLRAVNEMTVHAKLQEFLQADGSINATAVQANWFPSIKADVFISHSHRDEQLALIFAGWLSKTFGLCPFIDSCVWGNSAELQKDIDDEYCLNSTHETYSYEKRNGSTAHVHLMLATALSMMIDKTECAMVLRTPNSITSKDVVAQTSSPWIYAEIAAMHTIRRQSKEEHRGIVKKAETILGEQYPEMHFVYTVQEQLESMTKLEGPTLTKWSTIGKTRYPLDQLYDLAPEKKWENRRSRG